MNDFEKYTPQFVTQEFLKPLLSSGSWAISKTIKRRDCIIFKAHHKHFKSALCVKIYSAVRTEHGTPEALYKALQAYHVPQSHMNVPAPYAYDAKHGAVIMEWVETPRWRNIIWKLLVQRKKTIRRAGQWLKWFHDQCDQETTAYKDTSIPKIKRIINSETFSAPKNFDACYNTLEHQIQKHTGTKILSGTVHGDFTPYNILHDKQGRLVGIDFTAQETAPLYTDIARFFMYLNSYRPVYMSARADYNALIEGYDMMRNNDVHRVILFGEVMRRWAVLRSAQITRRWNLWREIEIIRISFMAKALQKSLN